MRPDDQIRLRHRLVHAYFGTNLGILRKAVKEGLPPLIAEVEKALPPEAP